MSSLARFSVTCVQFTRLSPFYPTRAVLAQDQCFTGDYRCRRGPTDSTLTNFTQCCNAVLQDFTLERSFGSRSDCFSCLGECCVSKHRSHLLLAELFYKNNTADAIFFSSSNAVLGLRNSTYLLNENTTAHELTLKVLSTPNTILIRNARLRVRGIPGSACKSVNG